MILKQKECFGLGSEFVGFSRAARVEQASAAKEACILTDSSATAQSTDISVALLTGGSDKPYVYGLTTELSSRGVTIDLIGSDELDGPDLRDLRGVNFLKFRHDQRTEAAFTQKALRISKYYWSLIRYAASAKPTIFHILWNNRFVTFDRTVLMLYYKLLGKRVLLTAHNVNEGRRDSTDSLLNRMTLRFQYRLTDHIFVHTERGKDELRRVFGVCEDKVTVIPFGINNSVPDTGLSSSEAKKRLGIRGNERTFLFFGRITPYKGLEYLVTAFQQLQKQDEKYKLIIAGRLEKGCERYWATIQEAIQRDVKKQTILCRVEFIPDSEVEVYFRAADVFVLPYKEIFQSGVLFLGYSFGLPVIAADVGSLKDDIVDGKTGFTFRPQNANDLAATIERYFASDLFKDLANRRVQIRSFANERHSWNTVGDRTIRVYTD